MWTVSKIIILRAMHMPRGAITNKTPLVMRFRELEVVYAEQKTASELRW